MTTNLFERFESGFQSLDPYHQNTVLIDVLNGIVNGTVAVPSLKITGDITVGGSEHLGGDTITGDSVVTGNETITGNESVGGTLVVAGNATITGNETVTGTVVHTGNATFSGSAVIGATGGVHALGGSAFNLTVTATANTDFTMAVPPGSTVVGASALTTTTFGAATDAKVQLGSSVGGSDYVAAASVSATGAHALTLLGAANLVNMPALAAGANIYGRLVQSGTASSVGGSTVVVQVISP